MINFKHNNLNPKDYFERLFSNLVDKRATVISFMEPSLIPSPKILIYVNLNFNKIMSDLKDYKNPITTKENINELHHLLVQTRLDYMKEHKLADIDEIQFSANGLSSSYESGGMDSCTRFELRCNWPRSGRVGRQVRKKYEMPARARIGFSM